jgi:hydroxymethylbilane synthase
MTYLRGPTTRSQSFGQHNVLQHQRKHETPPEETMASATATNLDAPAQSTLQGVNTSTSTQFPPINIGTRNSTLAQIQARAVAAALKSAHPERTYTICPVVVEGDRDKITPLQQLSQGENAKSLWTGELEAMLEKGDLDIIVHCLKGMAPRDLTSISHIV